MALVYKHIRLDNEEIFYIGIGKSNKRLYSTNYRNKFWHNIVNKVDYKAEIIYENISWEEAKLKEIELIKKYGRIDIGTGILVNMTDGGDGANGYKHTEEWKLGASKRNKGKIISQEQINIQREYMKNRIVTDETKSNISKGIIKYFDEKGRKPKKEQHRMEDLIWVNKNNKNKRIFKDYIEKYINEGWIIGRFIKPEMSDIMSKKGSKWMNNGINEAMILKNEINNYLNLNWNYGRIKWKNKIEYAL